MKARPRRDVVVVAPGAAVLLPTEHDREVGRLLAPLAPLPVPERVVPRPFPGWLAYQVLGCRIITAYRS